MDLSNFNMILSYQQHRTFAVRFAVSADLDAVQQLVNSTSHADTILHDVENYLTAKRDKILEVSYLFIFKFTCMPFMDHSGIDTLNLPWSLEVQHSKFTTISIRIHNIHTYICTYVHTQMHTFIRTYIVRVYVLIFQCNVFMYVRR